MTLGLQVISESKEMEVDRGIWKIILLAVLGILMSVASVSGFNRLLMSWNSLYIWPTAAAFVLFLVFTVLQIFLIKSRIKFALIAFLESMAPLALFLDRIYPQPDWILIAGAVLAFALLFSAMNRGRRILADSVKISFFSTSRMFLSRAALGFFFFFTVLVFLNYFSWGYFNANLGRAMVEGALVSGDPIAKVIAPGVSLNSTAGQFFNDLARSQLRDSSQKFLNSVGEGEETQFRYLPPKDQEKIVTRFSVQLENVFRERFGDFNSNDKISNVAYSVIATYAVKLNAGYPWLIPFSACVLFFLFVKGIFALVYWLIALIAYMFFKLLIAFGFAHLSSEQRSREFVLLS
ncbi:MAG: hypothetical protein ABSE68_01815 [Minisyncoccia bacterium]